MAKVGGVWLGESYRIDARVHSTRAHELERSERSVADSHSITSCAISSSFQFEVEPHHELLGLLIIEHLRSLDDATALDVASCFL